MHPGIDGLEVCRRLQAKAPTPILMLTAKGDQTDKIVGLELGAADYVVKPFDPRELMARVKAILRTVEGARQEQMRSPEVLVFQGLRIDLARHEVRLGEETVDLTHTEFELLRLLASQPGRVFTFPPKTYRTSSTASTGGISLAPGNPAAPALVSPLPRRSSAPTAARSASKALQARVPASLLACCWQRATKASHQDA